MTGEEPFKDLRDPNDQQRGRILMTVAHELRQQRSPARSPARKGWGWAAAAAGVAAVTVGTVVIFGGSSVPAWAATPQGLQGQELADAREQCQQRLADLPNARTLSHDGLVVLGEKRGSTSSVLLGGGDHAGFCIETARSGLAGVEELSPRSSQTKLTVDSVPGQLGGPGATRAVYGRLAPEVVRVEIVTTDGTVATASQRDGFYLAWWPSGADVRTATGYDSTGSAVAVVEPPSRPRSNNLVPSPTSK